MIINANHPKPMIEDEFNLEIHILEQMLKTAQPNTNKAIKDYYATLSN